MYKPLGLGCGHKFCTECVLSVVQVEGADLLKPLRRILADVPHGTACPQCRQRAVFYNAVELKKLGAFIYATCAPLRCLLPLLSLHCAHRLLGPCCSAVMLAGRQEAACTLIMVVSMSNRARRRGASRARRVVPNLRCARCDAAGIQRILRSARPHPRSNWAS